jgi:nucleoside-diphosphate kinase
MRSLPRFNHRTRVDLGAAFCYGTGDRRVHKRQALLATNRKTEPRTAPRLVSAALRADQSQPPGAGRLTINWKGFKKMERTLSIIKPDGVARGLIGEVIKRFEANGVKIVAMKMICMAKTEAEGFYAVHRERPFFQSLTGFMSSGPVVVMVLEGEGVIALNRKLMGATNFKEADPGTIRADFATDIEKNVVHGSDSPETAAFEIGYFFNRFEFVS